MNLFKRTLSAFCIVVFTVIVYALAPSEKPLPVLFARDVPPMEQGPMIWAVIESRPRPPPRAIYSSLPGLVIGHTDTNSKMAGDFYNLADSVDIYVSDSGLWMARHRGVGKDYPNNQGGETAIGSSEAQALMRIVPLLKKDSGA